MGKRAKNGLPGLYVVQSENPAATRQQVRASIGGDVREGLAEGPVYP